MAAVWLTCLLACLGYCHGALQLNSYFGSHMVLQKAPQQAVLWGTADTEGDTVTVRLQGASAVTTTVTQGQWKVKLPAQSAGGPHVISVTSADGHVTLRDVMFGDVWLCSGQSNMYLAMNSIINATQETQDALTFTDIRLLKATLSQANTPQSSLNYTTQWTAPTAQTIPSFSAVCFLFGKYLYPHVNYPIGLVESSWGGTPVEAWSPPEAISQCAHHTKRGPHTSSVLWNAMINPMQSNTFFGALWYQGEANARQYAKYSCQIQAMVSEWRQQFHQSSLGQTSSSFPFGYVQLAPNQEGNLVGSFPGERWAQTANYGYSPNPLLPDTFMAVAMDLPDYHSPRGSIHPRYKQDVAKRLMLGALNVAYGQSGVTFQGPFPTTINSDGQPNQLAIVFDQGHANLEMRNQDGFEVCCSAHNTTHCDDVHDHWVAAPITRTSGARAFVSTSGCGTSHVVGLRYEWRTSPCDLLQCSLYGADSGLPVPPYITKTLSLQAGPTLIG